MHLAMFMQLMFRRILPKSGDIGTLTNFIQPSLQVFMKACPHAELEGKVLAQFSPGAREKSPRVARQKPTTPLVRQENF